MELFVLKMDEQLEYLSGILCRYEEDLACNAMSDHMKTILRGAISNLRIEIRTIAESIELYRECEQTINHINICCL